MRCHCSRGGSGQGEAKRTNAAISDALVDGATLEWEKCRRFEDLSEEESRECHFSHMKDTKRSGWRKMPGTYAVRLPERIDDAPSLKDYFKSKVSEPSEELFFFNSAHLDRYQSASGRNKMEFPGAAYFRKFESFTEDHYIRAELFMDFCCDA